MNKKTIHYILIGLNLIAILFILQIELNFVPLIPSGLSFNLVKKINSLVSAFSQGLMLSTMFYILVVFIPDRLRRKTAMGLILPRLRGISTSLQQSIGYLCYKHNLPAQKDTFRGLEFKHFEKITKLDNELKNFEFRRMTGKNWSIDHSGDTRELESFVRERDGVISSIDEILSLPIIQYVDDELIESLATLRNSWFYSVVDQCDKSGLGVNAYKFNEGVYIYYKIYQKLNKYITPYRFEIIREEA